MTMETGNAPEGATNEKGYGYERDLSRSWSSGLVAAAHATQRAGESPRGPAGVPGQSASRFVDGVEPPDTGHEGQSKESRATSPDAASQLSSVEEDKARLKKAAARFRAKMDRREKRLEEAMSDPRTRTDLEAMFPDMKQGDFQTLLAGVRGMEEEEFETLLAGARKRRREEDTSETHFDRRPAKAASPQHPPHVSRVPPPPFPSSLGSWEPAIASSRSAARSPHNREDIVQCRGQERSDRHEAHIQYDRSGNYPGPVWHKSLPDPRHRPLRILARAGSHVPPASGEDGSVRVCGVPGTIDAPSSRSPERIPILPPLRSPSRHRDGFAPPRFIMNDDGREDVRGVGRSRLEGPYGGTTAHGRGNDDQAQHPTINPALCDAVERICQRSNVDGTVAGRKDVPPPPGSEEDITAPPSRLSNGDRSNWESATTHRGDSIDASRRFCSVMDRWGGQLSAAMADPRSRSELEAILPALDDREKQNLLGRYVDRKYDESYAEDRYDQVARQRYASEDDAMFAKHARGGREGERDQHYRDDTRVPFAADSEETHDRLVRGPHPMYHEGKLPFPDTRRNCREDKDGYPTMKGSFQPTRICADEFLHRPQESQSGNHGSEHPRVDGAGPQPVSGTASPSRASPVVGERNSCVSGDANMGARDGSRSRTPDGSARSSSPGIEGFREVVHGLDGFPRLAIPASPPIVPRRPPSKGNKRETLADIAHRIPVKTMRPYFNYPLRTAAEAMNISVTTLKRLCRRHGVKRWPHRQISGINRALAHLEYQQDQQGRFLGNGSRSMDAAVIEQLKQLHRRRQMMIELAFESDDEGESSSDDYRHSTLQNDNLPTNPPPVPLRTVTSDSAVSSAASVVSPPSALPSIDSRMTSPTVTASTSGTPPARLSPSPQRESPHERRPVHEGHSFGSVELAPPAGRLLPPPSSLTSPTLPRNSHPHLPQNGSALPSMRGVYPTLPSRVVWSPAVQSTASAS